MCRLNFSHTCMASWARMAAVRSLGRPHSTSTADTSRVSCTLTSTGASAGTPLGWRVCMYWRISPRLERVSPRTVGLLWLAVQALCLFSLRAVRSTARTGTSRMPFGMGSPSLRSMKSTTCPYSLCAVRVPSSTALPLSRAAAVEHTPHSTRPSCSSLKPLPALKGSLRWHEQQVLRFSWLVSLQYTSSSKKGCRKHWPFSTCEHSEQRELKSCSAQWG
mmetsp:Transcript_20294/g.27936  ORF Transcript_20294/g.27936 Transcript_20294/m.27936 type:complete len:219 (-) Transcript_20294:888-1544(-)